MPNGYISREAAINEVGANSWAGNRIARISAADEVEVVRCKDCNHFIPNSKIDSICSGFCKKANWSKSWNDFCSDGERRTEDGES